MARVNQDAYDQIRANGESQRQAGRDLRGTRDAYQAAIEADIQQRLDNGESDPQPNQDLADQVTYFGGRAVQQDLIAAAYDNVVAELVVVSDQELNVPPTP
jgi:CCR4-NOT transcriptional regulation complex NOT5 subunit